MFRDFPPDMSRFRRKPSIPPSKGRCQYVPEGHSQSLLLLLLGCSVLLPGSTLSQLRHGKVTPEMAEIPLFSINMIKTAWPIHDVIFDMFSVVEHDDWQISRATLGPSTFSSKGSFKNTHHQGLVNSVPFGGFWTSLLSLCWRLDPLNKLIKISSVLLN